jgi:hypothetical protein
MKFTAKKNNLFWGSLPVIVDYGNSVFGHQTRQLSERSFLLKKLRAGHGR